MFFLKPNGVASTTKDGYYLEKAIINYLRNKTKKKNQTQQTLSLLT